MSAAEFQLRQGTPADAAAFALVGGATFLDGFAGRLPVAAILGHAAKNHNEAAYARFLTDAASTTWLAEALPGNAPVGYAVLTTPDFAANLVAPGDTELRRIYVLSRFHGPHGPGQALMDAAVEQARAQGKQRLLLGVHRGNERAIAFYRRNGFDDVGVRTFQVGPNVFDDLVLGRAL